MALHHMSAVEATALFRSRELSPSELLEAVIARTADTEPAVNAVTEQWLDEAREDARRSEQRFASGEEVGPLEGIPLMLKDEQPVAGRLCEDGSMLEKGRIADVTHPIVDRIREAGAVIHGRTTTPEFCCASVTHSDLWGVTRNPWNLALTPGGSSGGSGAVLAAGSTILATGSDIGGSIRIPSSFCGVVGYKPPFGRVPGLAPFNSDTYCADGPMGRSVADVALLQNVIAGPWSADQASLRPPVPVSGEVSSLRGTRIALCVTLGGYDVDPVIAANTQTVAAALRAAGAEVEEVTLPWQPQQVLDIAWAHYGAVMGPFIEEVAKGDPEMLQALMPYTRAFVASAAGASDYVAGLCAEAEFYRPFGELMERFDALVCPTMAVTGLDAEAACLDTQAVFKTMMTVPFNVIGRVPVLAVPSGKAPNGVPTGVQIVGRTYDDASVFRIGAALEHELALWTDPAWWPGVPVGAPQ
ncbi:Asp-tRNA(Asn)/Glu-tRNA(Gln) amidotransferase A subunit family amidase [Mycobacterium frederiksbergense]|uniref:amidase n=1 Tax=Mycolicibacterium frederiksbergense TaxID=117567 RepID=A0ABT6L6C0_9MYCO|nr:amidase [Mycolicibacterium frederiksbergense]MDH6198469.1 Asp-tRNA(Asn)/Glu-tRNA(Gln) amidotransferase A subunit family amidase [Mycolicibacterium frederiksbergense]